MRQMLYGLFEKSTGELMQNAANQGLVGNPLPGRFSLKS